MADIMIIFSALPSTFWLSFHRHSKIWLCDKVLGHRFRGQWFEERRCLSVVPSIGITTGSVQVGGTRPLLDRPSFSESLNLPYDL